MTNWSICDLHCDSALFWQAGSSLEDTTLHVSLPCLEQAGVGLQVFAAYVPASVPRKQRFDFARRTLDRIEDEIAAHSDRIVVCRDSGEVEAVAEQGKIAAILAVENGDAIEGDPRKLRQLHEMGVRLMTLIHSQSNDWVISCSDKAPRFDGLTALGERVVAEMNDLGMIIDVSHAHDRVVERVLACSKAPIVASHSGMYSLCPVPRNLNDDLIRGISASGGVVGLIFLPDFLDCARRNKTETRARKIFDDLDRKTAAAGADCAEVGRVWRKFVGSYQEMMKRERMPLEKLLQHMDHLVALAGEDHAAFGSDFDGIPETPAEFDDCRGFPLILDRLRLRGYSEQKLEKICWSNFLRVFKNVCG